jgi:hypothetical protein
MEFVIFGLTLLGVALFIDAPWQWPSPDSF